MLQDSQVQSLQPRSLVSPGPPNPLIPHHSHSLGAEPWVSRSYLDLGKDMSTSSSQGEGRPYTWSLLDGDFLQAPRGQCNSIAKADKKSRHIPPRLHRGLKPLWGKYAKGWKHCVVLVGAKSSCFLLFPVLHWNTDREAVLYLFCFHSCRHRSQNYKCTDLKISYSHYQY